MSFLFFVIDDYIDQDWSPELAMGALRNRVLSTPHHETIYQYILVDTCSGGELHTHLRHQNKAYS